MEWAPDAQDKKKKTDRFFLSNQIFLFLIVKKNLTHNIFSFAADIFH